MGGGEEEDGVSVVLGDTNKGSRGSKSRRASTIATKTSWELEKALSMVEGASVVFGGELGVPAEELRASLEAGVMALHQRGRR
jgi:hypothetical protein